MGMTQIIPSVHTAPSAAVTNYLNPGVNYFSSSSTESGFQYIIPASGTISKLYVTTESAPGTSKSLTFTFRKNGVGTSTTCQISGSNKTASDFTNSFSVSAGDLLSISCVPSGSPTTSIVHVEYEFTSTNNNENICSTKFFSLASNNTRYYGMQDNFSSTAGLARLYIPHSCTIIGLYVNLTSSPGSGKSRAISIYKNGSEEASSIVTISDANTTGSVTGLSISLSAGDYLQVSQIGSGTPTATTLDAGILFQSATNGESILGNFVDNGFNTLSTIYAESFGLAGSLTGTETNIRYFVLGNGTSTTLKNMYVKLGTAPGSGKSWTLTLRQAFTGSLNQSVVISDANTSGQDSVNTDTFSAVKNINLIATATSSPTGSNDAWVSFTQYIAPTGGGGGTQNYMTLLGVGA